jgi:3-hexulose-6-phosphate synthase / 6-phospho-3-hexuloisomerase
MKPVLQVALDFVDLSRALKAAREAIAGGADWLEVGTPLLKSDGLEAVRALRREYPKVTIVCDTKTMDAGRIEVEAAAEAGAGWATVMGAASSSTIVECVEAGAGYGIKIAVDMLGIEDPVARAREAESLGAHLIGIHCPIDDQMRGGDPFETLRRVVEAVQIPVAVAGGLNSETVAKAIEAGASVVIVGGAITKAEDARGATETIREAMRSGKAVASELFRRVGEKDIREVLERVSTPNISDGNHRIPCIPGIRPIDFGYKMVGPALTVRTTPGDWAKTVEAIDEAEEGGVIVIDAGGVSPAVWGELATHSACVRKLAGIVVHGAVRDTIEIRKLKMPVFATLITSEAGYAKGHGEIGMPLRIGNVHVSTGDWIVGDDDGVMVLPKARAVEMANRAQDWLEKENRIRKEIVEGRSTLAEVAEIYKWERK